MGSTFYRELSPETDEFWRAMREMELMDVLARTGKAGGGYCTRLQDYHMPFIFASFNGTSHDVKVITHEAGHAFAVYLNRFRSPADSCLSCHEPVITEQVGEVMKWTSDDYPMTADGTKLADGADMASEEFCAKSGCHDMDDVVASTWGFEGNGEQFNPHSSHQDLALECGDCHKAHEKSVLMCNQCHKLNMPEGWEAPNAA